MPRQPARHFGGKPGARLTGVHSDDDLALPPGFHNQLSERRSYRVGSFRVEGIGASQATDPIRAK